MKGMLLIYNNVHWCPQHTLHSQAFSVLLCFSFSPCTAKPRTKFNLMTIISHVIHYTWKVTTWCFVDISSKIPIWFSQNWGKKNMSPQQHSQFTHIWFVIWYSSSSSLQNIPISRYLVLRLIPRVPFPTLPHWCDYYMVSSSALALLPKEI